MKGSTSLSGRLQLAGGRTRLATRLNSLLRRWWIRQRFHFRHPDRVMLHICVGATYRKTAGTLAPAVPVLTIPAHVPRGLCFLLRRILKHESDLTRAGR